MTKMAFLPDLALAIVCAIVSFVVSTPARAAEFSYDDWNDILSKYVDGEGLVDYAGLAADREALDQFIKQIVTTGPKSDPEAFPSRQDQLAYFINAYNAYVFAGVLDLGPDAKTVWGFSGTGYGFFVRMKVGIDGEKMSLKALEDDIVRERFKDPRIHAALNCASKGCPKLPSKPFLPETLDEQLDAEMTKFVGEERNCKIDEAAKTATLSKIFDWFRQDFDEYEAEHGGGDLRDYVNRFRPEGAGIPAGFKLKFARYDKKLNRQ